MVVVMNLKLYELREYHNLTQEFIAGILGICQQTYSEYEIGLKIIPFKHLITLANYYKVSIDYITNISNKNHYTKIFKLDKKVIGKNIVMLRKNNNMTQKDLAKMLNTTPSTICAYEKGKTCILTAFAIDLCKKLDISFDMLLKEKELITT